MTDFSARTVRHASVGATGVVAQGAGVLYFARLAGQVTGSQDVVVVLRDGTTGVPSENVLLILRITAGYPVDDWPRAPVAVAYERGVHATFTGTAGSAGLVLGYDTRR